jgi:hypothetical protein
MYCSYSLPLPLDDAVELFMFVYFVSLISYGFGCSIMCYIIFKDIFMSILYIKNIPKKWKIRIPKKNNISKTDIKINAHNHTEYWNPRQTSEWLKK